MTLCFTSRKLWRIMLRATGPIVGRIYRYYIMYETTIKFQFSFLIQKRVLFYSLTQRSLPTSWGTWTSPERIGKRAKIFILKGLELFNTTDFFSEGSDWYSLRLQLGNTFPDTWHLCTLQNVIKHRKSPFGHVTVLTNVILGYQKII